MIVGKKKRILVVDSDTRYFPDMIEKLERQGLEVVPAHFSSHQFAVAGMAHFNKPRAVAVYVSDPVRRIDGVVMGLAGSSGATYGIGILEALKRARCNKPIAVYTPVPDSDTEQELKKMGAIGLFPKFDWEKVGAELNTKFKAPMSRA